MLPLLGDMMVLQAMQSKTDVADSTARQAAIAVRQGGFLICINQKDCSLHTGMDRANTQESECRPSSNILMSYQSMDALSQSCDMPKVS